mgnify:CR=1 FL=1
MGQNIVFCCTVSTLKVLKNALFRISLYLFIYPGTPLDSFEPFPGSARKCGAFGVFLLWKFQSVGILQTFLWTYRLERKKQFLVEDSFTCHKICYTEVN